MFRLGAQRALQQRAELQNTGGSDPACRRSSEPVAKLPRGSIVLPLEDGARRASSYDVVRRGSYGNSAVNLKKPDGSETSMVVDWVRYALTRVVIKSNQLYLAYGKCSTARTTYTSTQAACFGRQLFDGSSSSAV